MSPGLRFGTHLSEKAGRGRPRHAKVIQPRTDSAADCEWLETAAQLALNPQHEVVRIDKVQERPGAFVKHIGIELV